MFVGGDVTSHRDGQMPVMDGLTATKALRDMGVRIPIVAVTGNALMEDQQLFRAAGADAVLCKPINKQGLQKTLQQYLPSQSDL